MKDPSERIPGSMDFQLTPFFHIFLHKNESHETETIAQGSGTPGTGY
jgi:hypothetical protein